MGISLLDDLASLASNSSPGEFETAFLITYTLNLRFFEQLVLPRLNRLGVVNVGILVDEHGYQTSLDDPLGQELCGKSYVVGTSPYTSSLQHAKALWIHGKRDLVYVGSHNLTMPGFNDQLEITAKLDSRDNSHIEALSELHRAISTISQDTGYLQQIWSKVTQPNQTASKPTIHFLWSGEKGLLQQLTHIIGNVEKVRVLTPFLDSEALADLKRQFGASDVTLIIPNEGADTPLVAAMKAVPKLKPLRVGAGIRLHAKAYSFQSETRQWLVLGSANCTHAGLIKGIPDGGNVEFLVVLPDGSISEDELKLEQVNNVEEMSGTGQRWDEESANKSLIKIRSAEFSDGVLTVVWESACQQSLVDLVCVEQRYPCEKSPFQIHLNTIPPSIVLETKVDGKISIARSWVIFPEELNAQVSKAHARRWQEFLDSENPSELAVGIDAYFLQLLHELMSSEADNRVQFQGSHMRSTNEINDAIEIFTFSSDKTKITSSAAVLVSGNSEIDPLGALRGLVAKIRGTPSSSLEGDDEALSRYENGRQRAERQIADKLINHLNLLSGSKQDWISSTPNRIVSCLRGTFEATTLLWHDVIVDDARPSTTERFVESFLQLLNTCDSYEQTKVACRDISVAGPLVLAIGAVAEATDESETYELLRIAAKAIVVDPRTIIKTWLQRCSNRATLLLSRGHGDSQLSVWVRPALSLLGQMDLPTQNRQEDRWGLLLKLYDAERTGAVAMASLYEEAEIKYNGQQVWQFYKAYRVAGHLIKIKRVTGQVCTGCFQKFPAITQNELQRGEAVLCPNCKKTILLWGNV